MRDVLDDDERKLRPVSMLLIATGILLSGMIIYNGLNTGAASKLSTLQATTRMEVTVPAKSLNTVVFKYDADVEDIQRELLASGHYKGMVDGVMGQRTTEAVQNYQRDNGLSVTGQVSPELINHIRYTRKIKAAAEFTGSVEPPKTVSPAPAVQTALSPERNSAKPTMQQAVLRAQMSLANLGYNLGEPTGELDEATRAAILQYEMDNGMTMDGTVDNSLLESLSKSLPKKISINN